MVSIPTSKSRTGENKLVAAVKKSIAWTTKDDSDAVINTVEALLSELTESKKRKSISKLVLTSIFACHSRKAMLSQP
jgi:hypothetical protein